MNTVAQVLVSTPSEEHARPKLHVKLPMSHHPSVPQGPKLAGTLRRLYLLYPIFSGKWTVGILSCLQKRAYRNGELLRQLEGVSQRILTRTLRKLESAGLVARRVTGSRSVAVEYSLTPLGKTFMAPLTGICRWADRYHKRLAAKMRPKKHQSARIGNSDRTGPSQFSRLR